MTMCEELDLATGAQNPCVDKHICIIVLNVDYRRAFESSRRPKPRGRTRLRPKCISHRHIVKVACVKSSLTRVSIECESARFEECDF